MSLRLVLPPERFYRPDEAEMTRRILWWRLKRALVAWAVWTGIVAAVGAVVWELMR